MAEKDITEKTLESYNDVFADVINGLMFGGRCIVKENELVDAQLRSFYKADGKIREQERDVSKYWKRNHIKIATLGIENQTTEDRDLPLRVMGYDGAAYRNQIRKGTKARYPVTTIALSFDYTKRWTKPLHLVDCFKIPKELRPYVNDYKVHLFEIPWLTREQVNLFRSDFRIVADYFVQMRENRDYVPNREIIRHVQEVLQLMAVMTADTRFEEAYQEKGSGTNMCEFLDRLEARGEVRGTILTYRECGLDEGSIFEKIMQKFRLDEQEARRFLAEVQ